MSDLYIVRHAIAADREEWAETGATDGERPLTDKGRRRFALGARGLLLFTGTDIEIYTSPLVRAAETAAILQKACPKRVPKKHLTALGEDFSARDVIKTLAKSAAPATVAVGHEPDLSELVETLITNHEDISWQRIKKGSAIKISFTGPVAAGKGKLQWYLEPRALRDLGASFSQYEELAS